jgi:thioredoxin reductase (NADPH)
MTVEKAYEVIIVGGGPAGLTAGLYCMRAALRTVLFEKGLPGGQIAISKEVENYPGVEGITGFDLAEKLIHHANSFGLNIMQQEVVAISPGPDYHSVRLAGGEEVQTVAVILASGASVRKLGIPGEAEYPEAVFPTAPHATGFSSGTRPLLWSEGATLRLKRRCISRN